MTSGKQARRQRQAKVARPPVRSTGGRQASTKVLLFAVAGLAGLAVAIGLAVAFSGGSSSANPTTVSALPDAAASTALFKGIPQRGNVLGKASAPVTMVEYIDLQCPVCRAFETEVMPTIAERYVRTGKLKVVARPIAFIGPDSSVAGTPPSLRGTRTVCSTSPSSSTPTRGPRTGAGSTTRWLPPPRRAFRA